MIPKIKVSASRKREKAAMSCTCSTTSNFGYVQPTFCREMLPKSKFSMQVASRVLLSGMPVPTFGSMFMKHYHTYVPYRDVCPQFESFLSNQPYSPTTGVSFYPNSLPELKLDKISQYILSTWADISIYPIVDGDDVDLKPVTIPIEALSDATKLADVKEAWNDVILCSQPIASTGYLMWNREVTPAYRIASNPISPLYGFSSGEPRGMTGDRKGALLCGAFRVSLDNTIPTTSSAFAIHTSANPLGQIYAAQEESYVTLESADYISTFGQQGKRYLIAFRLTPVGKRIRQILVGLGYQLSPNVEKSANWLKLLAFYKSWFAVFRPKRDISFTSTACYHLIKMMENPESVIEDEQYLYDYKSGTSGTYGYTYHPSRIVQEFIDDLGLNCFYYLPMDYFSMATTKPTENFQGGEGDSNFLNVPVTSEYSETAQGVVISGVNEPTNQSVSVADPSYFGNPLIQKAAQRVLKYVNKNTIVGRSIHDWIKAHFGVSIDSSHDLDSVYIIGESSTEIKVSELMNSAASDVMELGEFAGRGIGQGSSETFVFENNDTNGVWLTLTTIIPNSGFYQGVLKENTARDRFDFFTEEFDAVGYQVLERSEVSLDYPVSIPRYNVSNGMYDVKPDNAFGFVPRYSHLKVPRNIVNGDLSLRGYRNSMSGYTLDRMLPYDSMRTGISTDLQPVTYIDKPYFNVSQVSDEFRQVDPTDHLGNYNRIFYYARNDFDHFIINLAFKVDAYLPCISLSESFDTLDDEENVIELTHS